MINKKIINLISLSALLLSSFQLPAMDKINPNAANEFSIGSTVKTLAALSLGAYITLRVGISIAHANHIKKQKKLAEIAKLKLAEEQYLDQIQKEARDAHIRVVAFDVDGVIVKLNPSEMIANSLKVPVMHPVLFLRALWNCGAIYQNCKESYDKEVAQFNSVIPEQVISAIEKDRPWAKPLCKRGLDIANSKKLMPGTENVIRGLKSNGYTLITATNIAEGESIDSLKRKFDVFNLFDDNIVTTAQDGYVRKPQQEFYQKIISKYGNNVIFIDDKWENIEAARKAGLKYSIVFFDANDLAQKLHRLGVDSQIYIDKQSDSGKAAKAVV